MLTPATKSEAPLQGVAKFWNYSNQVFTCDIDHTIYQVLPGETLVMKENEARLMAKYLMEDYLYSEDAKSIPGGQTKDVGADPRREEYINKAIIPMTNIAPAPAAKIETEILNEQAKVVTPSKKAKITEFPTLDETPIQVPTK